jgi:LysM domain
MRKSLFLLLLSLAAPAHAEAALVHIVRPGETLASIAEIYYDDPRRESVLVAENGLTNEGGSAIEVGLRLVIPTVSYHKVEEGETWAVLATRFYGDPARAFVLIDANGGKAGGHPDIGAELLIPYPLRHVSGQNESLRRLAKTYYDSYAEMNTIRRFNESSGARVVRGQILLVPLTNLVLSAAGKKLAEEQFGKPMTDGEVRKKQEAIDERLPVLREHVRLGRYADAVALASRLVGGGDLSGNQAVTINRELGTALVALGSDDLALSAFSALLEQQPDAEFDSVRTSPKVLRVFDEARRLMLKQANAQQQKKRAKEREREDRDEERGAKKPKARSGKP